MKSMTKLIVVAMILAAALVVTPVAAARGISNGDTVFVGEDDLDLTAVFDNGTVVGIPGTLVYYSSTTAGAGTVGKTIPVINTSDFDLTATEIGSSTGTWYAFNKTPFTNPDGAAGSIIVSVPSTNLDVLLGTTGTTSVNGKSVTRDSSIRFQVDHNVGTLPSAAVEIRVTTPTGGTLTEFEGVFLDAANMTLFGKQKVQSAPISLVKATAGTYTARAVWPSGTPLFDKGYDSKPVTFEVVTGALAVTSNKDTVVRGNGFTVAITGESEKLYNVTITNAGTNPPTIPTGQVGISNVSGSSATAKTTAGGTRSIQFDTVTSTKSATYTIHVEKVGETNINDEVKVKVEAGSVTITTSGTGTYYIGEEITLSGTCTDNSTVHLFMTGPNLNTNGVSLEDLSPTFISKRVEADDTWSYKWNTGDLKRSLDAGGYTIYAVSKPVLKDGLANAKYATAPISLRSGFLTATTSGATVARGDKLTISGVAQGNPNDVFVWIFGKNFYGNFGNNNLTSHQVSVESDGSFEYKLETTETDKLAAGQYFVIVQHPMGASPGVFVDDVARGLGSGYINGSGIVPVQLTNLQAPAAASALINALDSPNVPDTYVKLTFVVAEPNIFIDPIGTKTAGSKFTISGTTNLAVGDTLNVEVTSAAFQPGSKTEASGFSSSSGNAVVLKGDGANKWSMEVDATGFKPDQYIVKVESIDTGTVATATFNVVAGGEPTTPPEGNVTTTTTTATTTTATTTTAATPTTTPGFGALVALAGLGAVAFLVLRRK